MNETLWDLITRAKKALSEVELAINSASEDAPIYFALLDQQMHVLTNAVTVAAEASEAGSDKGRNVVKAMQQVTDILRRSGLAKEKFYGPAPV